MSGTINNINPSFGSNAIGEPMVGSALFKTVNVTGTVLIKAGKGRVKRVNVITLVAAAIDIHDSATTGGVAASNKVYSFPASAPVGSSIELDFPLDNGLVIVAGAGVVSVSYSI